MFFQFYMVIIMSFCDRSWLYLQKLTQEIRIISYYTLEVTEAPSFSHLYSILRALFFHKKQQIYNI